MALIACPECGTQNDEAARFCKHCGTRLAAGCPVCGTVNPPDAKFCMNCGTNLTTGATAQPIDLAAAPSGSHPTTERRLVSVLFVDLVGFTTASEGRDAEDTRDLLTQYYDVAREIVGRYGGTLEKFIGDAVMSVWGAPTAHEDDAERAVRAGLELVGAVPRLDPGGSLQARAGVLTGEAAVAIGAEGQGMVAGDLVNTASRLQSAARPGTVLVGEATYRAANRAIAFESAGERELKGKEQPVAVWEATSVVARRGGAGRSATLEPPFVGRDDELQTLKDQFHAVSREGKPRLVTLTGIAGIGKSRLLWELEKYLDGVTQSVFLLSGRSPAYGEGISYWALAEMIRGRAGVAESDAPDVARERVREMLGQFVADDEDRHWIEPRIMGLLGLDELPKESRDELFAAWRTFLERIAEQSPVVMSFADLQWADQGMFDFIEHVLSWARSSPILVLAEARPELFDRRPGWGRAVRSATVIHLEPLGEADMRRLLGGLVVDMPADAMRRIVARAEGVPLYAVETLRMLLDRGVLEADGSQLRFTGQLPDLAVPETLHALIMSRLDGLPPEDRGLLSDAAVLGVSFTVPALLAVSGAREDSLSKRLDSLAGRELLMLDADPRSPERGQYRFLQGVVREVAYQSLAKRTRQAKHLAAARYFEALDEDELAGVLATHYLAAFRAAPSGPEADALAAQARVALRAAVDRAAALHDLVGALAYVEAALPITSDPMEQAALHERAVPLAALTNRFAKALEHSSAARTLSEARGDRLGVLRAQALEAEALVIEHQDSRAIPLLRGALADTGDLGPAPEIGQAQAKLSWALMLAGATEESIAWADRVLERPGFTTPEAVLDVAITKGTALQNLGRHREAEIVLRGAFDVSLRAGDMRAATRALNNLRAQMHAVNLREAISLAREVYDLAQKYGQQNRMIHSLMASIGIGLRLGTWDDWMEKAREEIGADAPYYQAWFRMQELSRDVYRGDAAATKAALDELMTNDSMRASEQAVAWTMAAKADAMLAEGDPEGALGVAKAAWGHSGENELAHMAALFAAATMRDVDGIEAARAAWRQGGAGEQLPLDHALESAADALVAAVEGRWADARGAFDAADRLFEGIDDALNRARLRLAFAGIARDAVSDSAAIWAAGEAFFVERGAAEYVAGYRRTLARYADAAVEAPPSNRSGAVRASG